MPDAPNPNNVRVVTQKVNDILGEIRIDTYLTNFSEQYRQSRENFIATGCATPVPVMNESDKYVVYPRGYWLRDEAKVRPLGGRPEQVSYRVESGQYLAEEWALEHTIDDRQRRNAAAPFDLDVNGTRLLEGKMLIREDRIWVSEFFTTGLWTFGAVGGVDFTPFNDQASEPIAFIDEQKDLMAEQTGFMPNTLVLGVNVARALRSNADIVERIKYTQRGIVSLDMMASMFEVDRVRVARSVYNTAAEGADDSNLDITWIADPNAMWLGYIEPTPAMDSPTAIARFGWTGLIPGANEAGGVVNRGRDDRAWTDWIQNHNAFAYKAVSVDLGGFYTNANVPVS